jgi:hypothetical protein
MAPEPSAGVVAHFRVLIERSRASRHYSLGSSVSVGGGLRGGPFEVLADRGDVHRPGEPEGATECTSAFGQVQAPQVRVQVRAPARKATPQIEEKSRWLPLSHHHADQVGTVRPHSAPDAGPLRDMPG